MRTKSSVGGIDWTQNLGQSGVVRRLFLILAAFMLGGLSALAAGVVSHGSPVPHIGPNPGPIIQSTNATLTIPQGGSTNFFFAIQDAAVGWSGLDPTTASLVNTTNSMLTNCVLTVTEVSVPFTPPNPPPGWTNVYSFGTNELTVQAGNNFGTNTIMLVSEDIWGEYSTNYVNLNVIHVSQPPSFSLATNPVVVLEDSGLHVITNLLTGITNGAGNPTNLTWSFSATAPTTTSTNNGVITTNKLNFVAVPAITNYNGTNGLTANLVFAVQTNSYGSNLVSVVMTDSGSAADGGKIAATNTFWLVVSHIVHPPVITLTAANNLVTLENGAPLTNLVSVSGDSPGSPLALVAICTNALSESASVVSTNIVVWPPTTTSAVFTLVFTPGSEAYGAMTNQVIASYTVASKTYLTTNYLVFTITHVSQPPTFSFASNLVVVAEESGAQTNIGFVKNISPGAGNPTNLTWTFTTVTPTNNPATNPASNVQFSVAPTIATNGTLTFTPAAHSFGTNWVTVIMTDSGSSISGGKIATTNTFQVGVADISHVPTITPVANQTILENGAGTNITINVWDYDAVTTNLAVTASAGVSNAATVVQVSVTATNVISATATNTQFTLHLAPVLNKFGTNIITLTASEIAGTAVTSSTNFQVVVGHVTQPPSFVFSTSTVTTREQATPVAITNANFLTSITNGAGNYPGTNWTFALKTTNTALFSAVPAISPNGTLTFTPAKLTNGTTGVTVIMTDTDSTESTANGGVTTYTNTFTLAISYLSTAPSFALATNTLVVPEESAAQTNLNFVTAINTGLGQPTNITWTFTTLTVTNYPATNAQFTVLPTIATNGTLTFTPMAHSYGTNLVTVIMTDSGTNGSCTNTFWLAVTPIAHTPGITWATNQTTLENSGVLTSVINVWDYDAAATNFVFTAVSLNPSLATVSVTATNIITQTNVQYTLSYTPVTDAFGATTIALTAGEVVGTNTLSSTTNFTLTVAQVSQPPSFAFATNVLVEPENAGPVSLANFLTALTAGAGNQPGLTWTFAVSLPSSPGNVTFGPFQTPAVTPDGTLTFNTLANSYGTNTVTVVMTDSGGVANGGMIAFTNSFTLQVPWINQPPSFNLGTNAITVDKYNAPVTVPNVAINILAGPANQSGETVSFQVSNNSSNLFMVQPAVDSNGTLTFTPGDQSGTVTVQIYAQNSGGTGSNGSGVDSSTNQTFTIIIPPNTFQNATGAYTGLFYGTNTLATDSSGYVNLILSTNGTFTGYLLCGTNNNAFTNQFDIAQSAATVQAGSFTLNLNIDPASQTLTGSVSNTLSTWTSALTGYLSGYGTNLDGTYTMVMPGFNVPKTGSAGDSTFYITNASGVCSLSGNLADSNQVTQVSPLCTNGYCPVYIPLYTNATGANGMLIGWLNFNNVANESTTPGSDLIWISNTNATSLYTKGFTNNVAPLISTFNAAQSQLLPINNGYIEMSGGDLTIPVVEAVTVVNNQIIPDPTVNNSMTLTINTNTGEMTGSFVENGITHYIESAILQNQGVAQGYFLGTGQSGSFILVANAVLPDSPPFPAFSGASPNSSLTIVGSSTPAGITNLVMLENSASSPVLTLTLYDPLSTTFTVTAVSSDTSVLGVALTGADPGNVQRQLTFTPVANKYETNITVTVTADDGTLTNTFVINATVSFVNQPPTFTLSKTAATVDQFGVPVSVSGVATAISAGPPSQTSWESVGFVVTNSAPTLFLVQPAVDANGTLTFTPASVGATNITVGLQATNSGGTDNNGVYTSASQLFTITIPANPFSTLLSTANNTNTFTGLFSDPTNVSPVMASSGYFSLVLTNDGSFTGNIICAGATNTFAGQFPISELTTTITTIPNYTLNLTLDPVGGTVVGSVVSTTPSWTATLQSYIETTTTLGGTYLVALPGSGDPTTGPVGDSIFTMVVTPDGVATLTGTMADNTPVTLVSHLSAAGNCPIYTTVYTNNPNTGLLFGWLTFTNDSADMDDLTSASLLTWFNNAGATTALYPAGFTNSTTPVASLYASSTPNQLANFSHYVVLQGGHYGDTFVTNVVTVVNDSIVVDPSVNNGLSLTINDASDAITGSFVDGAGHTNYIQGVILQNTNVAYGYFSSADGTEAGSFALFNSYTVPAGYTYPDAGGLTNVTLLENQSTFSLAFTLFDPLTTDITSVTASSSNPNFVTVSPNPVLNGTTCTLQITPALNVYTNQGPNNVVVSVVSSDGTLTSTNTIDVTVLFVNQAPTFGLAANSYTVDQFDVPVSVPGAITAIVPDPANGVSNPTVTFTVTNTDNSKFVTQPTVTPNGTLTFTPGFVGGTVTVGVQADNGEGTANGGVEMSASQTFTIYIPPNQFQAVTAPNVSAPFTGLYYVTNGVTVTNSGYVSLTLTNDGSFTLNAVTVSSTNVVPGHFSVSTDTASVTNGNDVFELLLDTTTGTVTGSVTNTVGIWNAELLTYLTTNAITPGAYTLTQPGFDDLSEGPVGYSVFTAGIDDHGVVTLAGFLADDTAVSQVTAVSSNGYCPVFIPLYPNGNHANGLLIGWLQFTNDLSFTDSLSDDSSLTWCKPLGATFTGDAYPAGFTNQAPVLASPYYSDAEYATNLLDSSSSSGYGYIMLSGADLGANPVVAKVGITNNVITTISTPNITAPNISLTITPGTGLIQGTYVDPKGFNNTIEGVIFQNDAFASGFFTGANTNQCGMFMLYGN